MKKHLLSFAFISQIIGSVSAQSNQVKTASGVVEGVLEKSGVYAFRGIPFAEPPVSNLRWKEPQALQNWEGVRKANQFGPRAMQPPIFGDMVFRSNGMSEDCLYLNVWSPSPSIKSKLPVLVYFYGGGFVAGDGSEGRYDGENMAKKGIVCLTVNYRLGVFGLLSHPELTKESPKKASGNYGLMDQAAALKWVKQNIAAFGGDPDRITIAGESAGSISVSALMISPMSKNIIAGAIGESGSLLGALSPVPMNEGEQTGVQFAKTMGANSIEELRRRNADSIIAAATKFGPFRFTMTIDGYFLPREPLSIFESGEQSRVPLLVGWNSEEMNFRGIMGNEKLTKENFEKVVKKLYGDRSTDILKVYHAANDAEVTQVATDLAGDRFIGFSTWRWAELQAKTSGKPVYRYYYSHPRPPLVTETRTAASNTKAVTSGAVHSAEIEYALGNLGQNKVYAWTKRDSTVSAIMQEYFLNFIKKGTPNGGRLPQWPEVSSKKSVPVLNINVNPKVVPEQHADRYLLMEQIIRLK